MRLEREGTQSTKVSACSSTFSLPCIYIREGSVGLRCILQTKVKVVAAQSVPVRELQRVRQAVRWAGRSSCNLHHFFRQPWFSKLDKSFNLAI